MKKIIITSPFTLLFLGSVLFWGQVPQLQADEKAREPKFVKGSSSDVEGLKFTGLNLGPSRMGIVQVPTELKAHPYRKSETLLKLQPEDRYVFIQIPRRAMGWAKVETENYSGWIPESTVDWINIEEVPDSPLRVEELYQKIPQILFERGWEEKSPEIKDLYKEVKYLTGSTLFDELNLKTGQNYKIFEYKEAKSHLYRNIESNSKGEVFAYYSGTWIPKGSDGWKEIADTNKDGFSKDFINAEHTWPQSMFDRQTPMVSDLHHLFPTLSIPNGRRSHFPFGYVDDNITYQTGSVEGLPGSKLGGDEIFEPREGTKGNTARAMLYFYVRYFNKNIKQKSFNEKEFWDSRVSLFLQWNRQDPPDAQERKRNQEIENYQGNRNPFIDLPELADRITLPVWQAK